MIKFDSLVVSEKEPLVTDLWLRPIYSDCCEAEANPDCKCPREVVDIDILIFGSNGWESLLEPVKEAYKLRYGMESQQYLYKVDEIARMYENLQHQVNHVMNSNDEVSELRQQVQDLRAQVNYLMDRVQE